MSTLGPGPSRCGVGPRNGNVAQNVGLKLNPEILDFNTSPMLMTPTSFAPSLTGRCRMRCNVMIFATSAIVSRG